MYYSWVGSHFNTRLKY